ncbi:MAG: hypothetical protein ACR2ND_05270 [Solirubrobacteraceae bacterium]
MAREPVAGDGVETRREPVGARDPAVGAGGRGRGFGGLGEVALILARIVQLITAVLVIIILLGIALVLLDANTGNSIVSTVHDAGSSLVGPFKDVFSDKDPKVSLAENWGIAAIVYLIVGTVIASAISRLAVPRDRVR